MSDQRISLDGVWDFLFCSDDLGDVSANQEWRTAVVPKPWQAQFEDLRQASGVGWYRRQFSAASGSIGAAGERAAILHFGAVDYQATVWVNGDWVGRHEGGYLPFEFNVIHMLREGDNEILVKVVDPSDDRERYPDFPFSEVPHGKQSWYGPVGGIWQSVWLEFRPRLHISYMMVNPLPDEAAIEVQVELSEEPEGNYQVGYIVSGPQGETAAFGTFDQALSGVIQLSDRPQLWSPDTPYLYSVKVTIQAQSDSTHTAEKVCGFRKVEARDGRIYLNDAPIYLRGALDQGYYPETIYTANSLELLEGQMRAAKGLGFNCLRTHIKVEQPRYYDVADRLGLLIWTEIPNWNLLTDASAKRAKKTFEGMVKRDRHHPSIIIWTLINENWGTDLTRNEEHRRWLADFYHVAKGIDPTRLIVDNSACCDNAHVASDLEDFHHYRAIPDHAREWDKWVAEFAGRGEWAWYGDYKAERDVDRPLLVSEFGNWGLPDPDAIQERGAEPWWFETGFDWGGGIVYPHGVLQRFEACGLGDLFPSYAEFARKSQEHMARSLHYEITTMRLHDAIGGYIVTEFTDVHWECNGLLTMQRRPKYLLDPLLKDVNQDGVVLLRPSQWNGRPGEWLEVMVQTKDVLGQQASGSIQWQFGGASGKLPAPGGMISVPLRAPGEFTLFAKLFTGDGRQLAANQVNLVCVETLQPSKRLGIIDNPALADVLGQLGYTVSEGRADFDVTEGEIVVACQYTAEVERYLRRGGRVLLLADPSMSNIPLPMGHVVPRAGSVWQGDWATSLAWIKQEGPLAHLSGGPLLEMAWSAIMPDAVIDGLPQWALRHHSWAGMAVGWVHKAVSLLAVLSYGRGRLLVTTFKLNEATLTADAVGQALFAGMVNML